MNIKSFKIMKISNEDVPFNPTNDVVNQLQKEGLSVIENLDCNVVVDHIGFYLITMSTKELVNKFSQKKAGVYKYTDFMTKQKQSYFSIPIGFESNEVIGLDETELRELFLTAVIEYKNDDPRFIKRFSSHLKLLKEIAVALKNV